MSLASLSRRVHTSASDLFKKKIKVRTPKKIWPYLSVNVTQVSVTART